MLLEVLLKHMTFAEAKAEWKRIEKKKAKGDTRTDGPWLGRWNFLVDVARIEMKALK